MPKCTDKDVVMASIVVKTCTYGNNQTCIAMNYFVDNQCFDRSSMCDIVTTGKLQTSCLY